MRRSHSPVRYLPWLARDVAIFPGLAFLGVIILIGLIFWRLAAGNGMAAQVAGSGAGSAAAMVQMGIWNGCLTIAVLMAIGGVVGLDLQRGYYRTYFSKPMPPWWHYLQRYLLGAVAVVVAPFVLGLALKLALHGPFGIDGTLIATIAMAYLLIASACVLLSVFTSYGWLIVFIIELLQRLFGTMTRNLTRFGVAPPWLLVWVHRVLPPFDLIQPGQPALHGNELVHVLVYGSAMLTAALLLLRYRPLGSGGRA